jgi:hypothetical protein
MLSQGVIGGPWKEALALEHRGHRERDEGCALHGTYCSQAIMRTGGRWYVAYPLGERHVIPRLLHRPIVMGKPDDEITEDAISHQAEHTKAHHTNEDVVGGSPQTCVADKIPHATSRSV